MKLFDILRHGGSIYIFEPIGEGHAIEKNQMRSLFQKAGFTEKYFNCNNPFIMMPPRQKGESAYDKKQ